MQPKRNWRDMPSSSFGPQSRNWIAVLPLAATEQHGPHLPLGVDSMIAEGMIGACIDALPDDAPVSFLPIQEICKSNEHIRFPGTLTLGWKTVIQAWMEIGESVHRAGVQNLILVTSHGGNTAPMEIVARELRSRHDMRVVTSSWGRLGNWRDIYAHDEPVIDIHAGLAETSVMLALRPDLVDMTRAKSFASDQTRLLLQSEKLAYHGAPANLAWRAEDLNPAGAVGDATRATAEAGKQDLAAVAQGFRSLVLDLMRVIEQDAVS